MIRTLLLLALLAGSAFIAPKKVLAAPGRPSVLLAMTAKILICDRALTLDEFNIDREALYIRLRIVAEKFDSYVLFLPDSFAKDFERNTHGTLQRFAQRLLDLTDRVSDAATFEDFWTLTDAVHAVERLLGDALNDVGTIPGKARMETRQFDDWDPAGSYRPQMRAEPPKIQNQPNVIRLRDPFRNP